MLRQEIDKLKEANKRLRDELETSQREGKRQAAPFRREEEERAEDSGEPGREEGHKGAYRAAPTQIDRREEVPLTACPHCGGSEFENVRPVKQQIEELPPREVETVKLTTYRGECTCCCRAVETTHPLKTSGAVGAAGTTLGPRAQAVATSLVYDQGLTLRKACEVLEELFGLKLSPGGLSQLAARAGAVLEPKEQALQQQAREADVQHVDETSWWITSSNPERQPHWLWVFAGEGQTIYRVDERRNREVVQETLGTGFEGVLVSDCLNIYDLWEGPQQKCYAHHFKAISAAQAEEKALRGEPSPYIQNVKALFIGAQALKAAALPKAQADKRQAVLEASTNQLLRPGSVRGSPHAPLSESEEHVRNRLWKQRDSLFTFLDHEEVEATNNLAERRLRPAITRRKLSCGNQTERGARTWEILASLAATYRQKGRSFVKLVREAVLFEPSLAPVR